MWIVLTFYYYLSNFSLSVFFILLPEKRRIFVSWILHLLDGPLTFYRHLFHFYWQGHTKSLSCLGRSQACSLCAWAFQSRGLTGLCHHTWLLSCFFNSSHLFYFLRGFLDFSSDCFVELFASSIYLISKAYFLLYLKNIWFLFQGCNGFTHFSWQFSWVFEVLFKCPLNI